MKNQKSLIKFSVSVFVAVWGMLTFFFMAGEDSPSHPVSDTTFFVVKLLAICSFLMLVKFCKYASKKGLL